MKVWDLRNFGGLSDPVAVFKHLSGAVTSVKWHKDDSMVFASNAEDLLFIHQGLKDVKEIHWHKKIPGLLMVTSHTGFDLFRTISV